LFLHKKQLQQQRDEFQKKMDAQIGILSLSANPDSVLMWSHYTEEHRGFAIGFDSSKLTFRGQRNESFALRPVIYVDAANVASTKTAEEFDPLLTKTLAWSYEGEWRIVRHLSDADMVIHSTPYDICLFKFPKEAISRIIIGYNTPKTAIDNATNAIRSLSSSRAVELFKAYRGSDNLKLEIRKPSWRDDLDYHFI
jgi:hypothetical protein